MTSQHPAHASLATDHARPNTIRPIVPLSLCTPLLQDGWVSGTPIAEKCIIYTVATDDEGAYELLLKVDELTLDIPKQIEQYI